MLFPVLSCLHLVLTSHLHLIMGTSMIVNPYQMLMIPSQYFPRLMIGVLVDFVYKCSSQQFAMTFIIFMKPNIMCICSLGHSATTRSCSETKKTFRSFTFDTDKNNMHTSKNTSTHTQGERYFWRQNYLLIAIESKTNKYSK